MHKAALARLALVVVLLLPALSGLYAQSPGGGCENPGEFDFTTQVCPNGPGSAVSRYGPNSGYTWSTYQWTVTGGTIVSGANAETMYFTAGPEGAVEITLAVTSASCSGTKTHTAVITPDQTADIHSSATVCPYSKSAATVMYGDYGSTYQWSITNGSFVGPTDGSNVQFVANGSGVVGLDVVVTNPNSGCAGTGHRDIPIAAPTLTIETYSGNSACPDGIAYATVFASDSYGTKYWWTAQNAEIVGSPLGQGIQYVADGNGPVTLSVTASTEGCTVSASRTIPLAAPSIPQIETNTTSVCPGGWVTFTVPNAADFANGLRWDYSGATYYDQTANSISLSPTPGSTEVRVTAYGQNPGCETSASTNLPVRDPDATISAPATVCPQTTFTASVPDIGSGGQYMWQIAGDVQMISGGGDREVVLKAWSGTVQVSAWVYSTTGTCQTTGVTEVQVGTSLTPNIRTTTPFCGTGTASVDNAANYSSVLWTISNGVFEGPNTGPTVNFRAAGSAPVQLTATVSNAAGCSGSNTVTVTPQAATSPALSVSASSFCSTGNTTTAWVTNGPFAAPFEWNVQGAVITYRNPAGDSIEFRNVSEDAVVVEVRTKDAGGCEVSASTTIPYAAPPVPVIEASPASHCGTSRTIAAQVTNASAYQQSGWYNYEWFVKNGYVAGQSGSLVTIQPTSSQPVEISVEVSFYGCRTRGTTIVPSGMAGTPPQITFSTAAVCPNGTASASVPEGSTSYLWSIQNGTFESPATSPMVFFRANGAGPVRLSVEVSTPESCAVTSSATLPLSNTTPPLIEFEQADICPNGPGMASTMPQWAYYAWAITNGTITGSATNSSVMYQANGNGPVGLTLQVWTSDNCTATSSASQPLRTTTPPLIEFEQADVCPNGPGMASTMPQWAYYSWGITNGTITGSANGSSVMYQANGNGPVGLTLQVWTSDNCTATSSASQPLRTTTPPLIEFEQADACPNGPGMASTMPQWAYYSWGITNGTITGSANGSSVMYQANGNGPVGLTLQVWTSDNCTATATASQPLRTTTPPLIEFEQPDVCPNGPGRASTMPQWAYYSWGITNGTITGSANGSSVTYQANGSGPVGLTLQVWTSENCTATATASQPLRAIPAPAITLSQTELCPGVTSGASAPAGYAGYSWSIANGTILTGANGPAISYAATGTAPVTLGVQVWTSDNCSNSSSVTVPVRSVAPATITASGPTTFCEGGSVTLTAGDAAAWQWSNGATTQSITVSASGSYSVTTTDAGGCPATSEPVSVTVDAAVSSTITAADAICEGLTGTASVADAGDGTQYQWSISNGTIGSGNGTPSILFAADGAAPVQLSVTVTRGTCSSTSAKTIAVNPRPAFTILASASGGTYDVRDGEGETMVVAGEEGTANATHEMCGATSVNLRASVLDASWTYVWSTGATGPFLNVTANGTYTLTATNGSGCVWSESATVVMKPRPVAAISGATTFCPNGSTTLTATGGDSYLWSNGATTPSITVNAAGTYSVQVTLDGCSSSASVTVTQAAAGITASGPTTFCDGGSVTLTANAAQGYLWSNGATTQSITVTASGTYTVQETFDGCTLTSDPVVVTVGPQAVTIAVDDQSVCPGQTIHFTSSVVGGTNLTYEWLDGNGAFLGNGTTLDLTPSQPGYGSVSLRVTDGSGCAVTSQTVTYYRYNTAKPVITPSRPSTTFCEGGNIMLEASEANSYLWSTGETTRWIVVSASGSYTVTTTDGSGCAMTSDPVTVTVLPRPAQPVITASGPLTFCEGGSVTLTGPAGYAQYLWSTGETTQSITVSVTRNVALTVINESGCDNTSDVQVTVNPLPAASITAGGPTTFCEGGSVTLTASAGSSYAWSNGATTQSITVNASGAYSVTVTNANGCSATSAATNVTVNAMPATPVITASGPTTFCEGGSVTLTAPSASSYAWSNGATTQSITVNVSGAYSVAVTNANGCSATSAAVSVTVTPAPATPVITVSGPTALCPGASVTLTAPAGYSYAWSNGATTQSITLSAAGSYSVTVTNANGCSTTSAAVSVTSNAPTAIVTQPQSVTMSRSTTRVLSVTASGTAPLRYQWYRGNSGDTSDPVAGQTSSTTTVGPYTKKGTYRYWVRVWSDTCPASAVNSATAVVTVTN